MSDTTTPTPTAAVRRTTRQAWNTVLTIYYANSISWRALKSGALLFLGFFVWAGSNVLYSYRPDLGILHYTMAYGFLLILYGPIHHLVVIPLALRWRRSGGRKLRIGQRLPNAMLAVFIIAVLVLGTFPAGPMTIDFASALDGAGADIDPTLQCVKNTNQTDATVHCHLSRTDGVSRVEVVSGDRVIASDGDPPFEFTIRESEMDSVVGEKQFRVVLRDENGAVIRRYTRRLRMIDDG